LGTITRPIGDRLRLLGIKVIGVQFGGASPDGHYANMSAYMWALGREWLGRGAIDKDPKLEAALCGPGYSSDRHDRLVLESKESMKKRGLHSPDDADALFLTFAQKVMPKPAQPDRWRARMYEWAGEDAWMVR
jgi:phage terminase large subunit